jgi:nucleoside-diphosphate-sugar epimerase
MHALIIGGNGFLGRVVVNKLIAAGHQVTVVTTHPPTNGIRGCKYFSSNDLLRSPTEFLEKCEVIVNLAMKRSRKSAPVSYEDLYLSNFELPLAVISKFADPSTFVINASTYIQESAGFKGEVLEDYSSTKELLSKELNSAALHGSFTVCDLYFFTLYGPEDREFHLVPSLLKAAKMSKVISLSGGNQLINLVYIDDAADIILRVISKERTQYQRFACWESKYLTIRGLVSEIELSIGLPIYADWGAIPYNGHEMFEQWDVPISKFPGSLESTSLTDGIRFTFESMN